MTTPLLEDSQSAPSAGAQPTTRRGLGSTRARSVVAALLLVFVGMNLRSVILAVPPILPQIQADLGLAYTTTGLLTALPVLVMGAAAWPAGMLAGRLGARGAVTLGLVLLGVGALLRGILPSALPLFLLTALLSLGIAFAQTATPVLVRVWFPTHVGLVSALFSDGLILGETLAAALTVPVILALAGPHAWPLTFVVWSAPVAVALVLWLWLAPAAAATVPPRGTAPAAPRQRTSVSVWHLGLLTGAGSLVYFGMNGWIASYNVAQGHAAYTPLALGVLNAAQLPVSLTLTVVAQRIAGRRWPFVLAGVLCLVAITGWVLTPGEWQPLWAALLGGSSACVFVLGIALPPLLAGPAEIARVTGGMLSIGYGLAFVGPLVGGALWDVFGLPALAFLPIAAAGLTLVVLGSRLPERAVFGIPHPTSR